MALPLKNLSEKRSNDILPKPFSTFVFRDKYKKEAGIEGKNAKNDSMGWAAQRATALLRFPGKRNWQPSPLI